MASVVSAAVVSGELIIGLDDGSIIRAGYVQGAQGLTGPQGPIGATGARGTDGNTILSSQGYPRADEGVDGDFHINTRDWEIRGPKGNGKWPKAKSMLPGPENFDKDAKTIINMGGGGGGGGGQGGGGGIIYTNTVQLTNSTRTSLSTKANYKVLPHPGVGRVNQEDANQWAFGEVFDRIDEVLPVFVGPNEPAFKFTGRLWFDTDDDKLYVYDGNFWEPIGGGTGGGGGISGLETVNDNWTFVQNNPQAGQWRFKDNSDAYDGGIEIEIHKESKDGTDYGIEAFKVDNTLRIYNIDNVGAPTGNGELFAHLTAVTVDSPSTYKLTYTIDEATLTAVGETHIVVAGAISLKDLDDRYINADGDTMDGPLVLKSPIVNDEHAATKIYVDDAIEDAVEVLDDKIDNLPPHVGQYVKKTGGDSMQGPLQVTGNRDPNAAGVESTIKALNIDSGQTSSLNLKWKGATKVYVGEKNVSFIGDIKFNVGGKKIYAGNNEDKGFQVNDSGVFYDGAYTVDRHVATKKNVDDAIALIGGDKEGLFAWDASSTDLPVGTWQFEGRSNPSYTQSGVQVVNIQKQDKNGLIFSEDDFKVGGQIEIKNVNNDDYLLGTVTNIVDGGPKSVQITFTRDNATGQATGDQTIKTVKEPLPYVNKAGDSMSGDLKMKDNAQIQFIDPTGSPTLIRAGREDAQYPMILDLRHPGGSTKGGYDIKVQGNSSYNSLRFTNAKGPVFEVNGGGGATFGSEFQMDTSFGGNRIVKLGDAVDDTDAVPYGQIKQEITDKFEEITATLSFGEFSYIATSVARGPGVLTSFGAWPNTTGEKDPTKVGSLGVHHAAGDDSEVDWNSLSPGDIIRWTRGTDVWQFRVNGVPVAQESGDDLWYQIPVNQGNGPTFIESGIGNYDYTLALLKLTGGSADLTDYLKLDGSNGPMTGNLDFNRNSIQNVNNLGIRSNGVIKINEDKEVIQFYGGNSTSQGFGRVQILRPDIATRGFVVRGREPGSTETDMFYSYHPDSNIGDSLIYKGRTDTDNSIQTKASVLDLIASGGVGGDGSAFQRHGPYDYLPGGGSISPGEFTSDSTNPKSVRQFTFHKKNKDGEDDVWSELALGEIITVGQASGDNYLIINYTVKDIQTFPSATIVDVDGHQTIVAYSDGSVVYNPNDAFDFLQGIDTFVIESQPATLNNVADLSNKASPAPAFNSYILDTGTSEPLLGIGRGKMIAAGTSNIQTPTRFMFSGNDHYGNGHKWGATSFDCPGSVLELYRKNGEGSLCLCKIYEFNRVLSFGTNKKFEFQGLVEKHSTTNSNTFIANPGVLEPNAEYLVRYQLNFTSTVYTIDAEGDPHYGDHRLEDVGHPVASTDAATKGYVDAIAGDNGGGADMPTYRFAFNKVDVEDLSVGEFNCYDSHNNPTTVIGAIRQIIFKGTNINGKRPQRDKDAKTWEGNLNSSFAMLTDDSTKTIFRASMSQVVNGHPRILYNAPLDFYAIYWTGGDTTVNTSEDTNLTNQQEVTFHCPELFF